MMPLFLNGMIGKVAKSAQIIFLRVLTSGTLESRKESVPDAIRAFGLYFSEIPEFDCKSALPSDRQMTTLQAIIFGMLLALTPSALFLTWVLWQEGRLPPHD
jgi:hypothetical protein